MSDLVGNPEDRFSHNEAQGLPNQLLSRAVEAWKVLDIETRKVTLSSGRTTKDTDQQADLIMAENRFSNKSHNHHWSVFCYFIYSCLNNDQLVLVRPSFFLFFVLPIFFAKS